jgi:hypothetical protein
MGMSRQDCIPKPMVTPKWGEVSLTSSSTANMATSVGPLLLLNSMTISVCFADAMKTKVRLIGCVHSFVTSEPSALRSIYVSCRSWRTVHTAPCHGRLDAERTPRMAQGNVLTEGPRILLAKSRQSRNPLR